MKKEEEELNDFLNESGKIGKLRKRLIALLLSVEDMHSDLKDEGEDDEEFFRLTKRIEILLSEFATSQRLADRMIMGLTPRERKVLIEDVPELLDIFGWRNRFDENGEIRIEE